MNFKLPKLRTPVRASFGFTAVGMAARAVSVLTTPIFTRLLVPGEYGLYTLYMSWLGLLTPFVTWNMQGGGLYRGLQKAGKEGRDMFLSSAVTLSLLPFGLAAAICLPVFSVGRVSVGLPVSVIALMFVQIFATGVLSYEGAADRYLYRPGHYAARELCMAFATPLLTYLLIRLAGLGAMARILSSVAMTSAVAVPAAVGIYRRGKRFFSGRSAVFLLRFYLPLLPHYAAVGALAESGRLLLGRSGDVADLGRFGVAYAVGTAPLLLIAGINSALQPWMFRKLAAGETEKTRSVFDAVLYLLAAATILTCLAAPEIFSFLAPETYRTALAAVIPAALSVLPHFLYLTFVAVSFYHEKTLPVTAASLLAAAVGISLNLFFVPRFGMSVIAVMTAVSYILLAVAHGISLRLRNIENPVNVKNALLFCTLTAIMCFIVYRLYPWVWIRISVGTSVLLLALERLLRTRKLFLEPVNAV